jgi:MerR family mercuric resistance operon transcriptional regulator/MerR family gold-responsive transcriptional activator of gol and ges genes|uniref:heavy metal-responsive transcriptional regulator n=1 Tax=Nitrospira cf. moscoviensis SBR1015 TaxID=96242 RepID=UPI000B3BB5F5|nr:heavy metal-responsive transcriptional regulator [Nitrospira cf. moscoviensis SBR1015]
MVQGLALDKRVVMASGLTIGQLAKMARVNVQTIRYYERRNLLQPSDRKVSGYRVYGDDALRRLRFIKNAQALGFSLREVKDLLNLRVSSVARCGTIQVKAQAKLRQVEAKARDLRALARALQSLIRTCQAGQPTDQCPILQKLDKEAASGR